MLHSQIAAVLLCLGGVHSAHILMMTLGTTRSHKMPFLELGQALVSRGHRVTLVSAFHPSPDSSVEEVAPLRVQRAVRPFSDMDMLAARLRGETPFSIFDILSYTYKACEALYSAPETTQLLSRKVDLLVLDAAYPDCMLGLVHHFGVPFIYINTVAFYSIHFSLAGNPTMYSATPFFDSPHSDRMTFWERSKNGFFHVVNYGVVMVFNKFLVEPLIQRRFGNDVPPNDSIGRNVSLILQNGHHTMTYPRPFLPGVIEIGCIQCKEPDPLPKELEDFVNGGNQNGFVYVSFGTSVKSTQIPKVLLSLLLKVFEELPYQVVWKYEEEGETISDLPKNVRVERWLPQQDLLGHSKIMAFVNHGGLNGVFEAVYHAVPMVTLPVFCDHQSNSHKAQVDGYAIVLDWYTVTVDNLFAAINEVINDKRYKQNAEHRSALLRDQPETPLDRAVWWVQYVVRHRGASHLQGAAKDLTLIQYFMLDSLAALVAVAYFIKWALKTIWYKFLRKRKDEKLKIN